MNGEAYVIDRFIVGGEVSNALFDCFQVPSVLAQVPSQVITRLRIQQHIQLIISSLMYNVAITFAQTIHLPDCLLLLLFSFS